MDFSQNVGIDNTSRSFNPKKIAYDMDSMPSDETTESVIPQIEKSGSPFINSPKVMAAGMALQMADEYLDRPYKEMKKKESAEVNRRNNQASALANLQNISQLYGNL